MDVETLIALHQGSGGRIAGEPPALFAAGIAAWTHAAPDPWNGRRYAGGGHGLVLILRGSGRLSPDLVVEPGTAIHRLPGIANIGLLAPPAAELWLAFARPLCDHLAASGLLRRDPILHPGLPPRLLADFADLLHALRQAAEPGDAPRLLARALAWLQACYALADHTPDADPWAARITRACTLLGADLGAPADLAAVAAALGTTPLVLRRRFRERLGCPPLAWRQHQRALRALELLRDQSVAQVARKLGYADPTSLSRHLRRQLG